MKPLSTKSVSPAQKKSLQLTKPLQIKIKSRNSKDLVQSSSMKSLYTQMNQGLFQQAAALVHPQSVLMMVPNSQNLVLPRCMSTQSINQPAR